MSFIKTEISLILHWSVPPPAKAADKTYAYRRDLGETKGIVVIAAHFKNAFSTADQNLASIDGIWQISDTPTEIV